MKDVLLVKYGEIAMRGKNRLLIENNLIKTIAKNIKPIGDYLTTREQGRFVIECRNASDSFDYDRVIDAVVNILGVTAVCPGIRLEDCSMENLRQKALEYFKENFEGKNITFKVETKRSNKKYPLNSREISADVGGYILNGVEGIKVDVHNPDVTLMIEIRNYAYIYSKLIKGFGGLPIESSSKATLLMSGGIDSPVAGFLSAKRGLALEAVYFNSPPYTSDRAKQKVIDLAKRLSVFTGGLRLHIVPFTEIQLHIYDSVPPEKMTVFLKRAMLKCAEKIALQNGSLALITGDSVGQVASQTLQAINAIDSACKELPVLRPLCAMDKQDIVDWARKIKTYDISIRPYEDCCTVFVAKHPETKPKKSIIEKIEAQIKNYEELIDKAVEITETMDV